MGSCVVLQKLLEYFYYDEIMMQQTLRLATDGELSDFKDIDLTKIHAMAERRLAMDDGEVFQKHRPRHIKGYEPKAVRKGDKCPDAPVTMMRGDDSTFHAVVREAAATAATVSSKAGEAAPPYVAVLLGSASCPVWQNAVAYLAHVEFGIRGIMVVHVYTKESVPAPRRSSVVVGRPVPTGHPAARSLLGALFTSSSPSVSFSYLFSPFLLGGRQGVPVGRVPKPDQRGGWGQDRRACDGRSPARRRSRPRLPAAAPEAAATSGRRSPVHV